MTIKLVFADKSELFVTDYTTDKTKFVNGDKDINISCEYNGKTYTVQLLLNIEYVDSGTPDVPDVPDTPDSPSVDNGLPAGAIVGIVLGSVAVVAAAAVATVLVIKKKNGNKN